MEQETELWLKLIDYGILAPSGDNSQPWEFKIKEKRLLIFSVPDNDNPAYNYEQRGTLIAIGALIENISIAASNYGFLIKCDYPKQIESNNLIANLQLVKSDVKKDELYDYIKLRCTNRKAYSCEVEEYVINDLFNKFSRKINNEIEVTLINDKNKIKELADAASLNEKIVLENKPMHEYFFRHIRWNDEEEKTAKSGLYLKTLEFPKPQEKVFALLKNWNLINILNKIGFAKMVSKTNGSIYSKSAIIGAVNILNDYYVTYIDTGRVLERIWLEVEKNKLSMQMITGILFFMQRIEAKKVEGYYKDSHIPLILHAYERIKKIFNKQGKIVLMFRIGNGGRPSAMSSRKNPQMKI